MGGGKWTASVYNASTTRKVDEHGTSFVYDKTAKATGLRAAHATMAPSVKAGAKSPFVGKVMRESCDSAEHPETVPVAVFFDVTGSMGHLPIVLQSKLPKLYGLLLAKGYVEHPQILFGAIGDAYTDHVPLQVGQFESDNRADENLENLYLEGGGGGGNHESYDLALYFMLKHTYTDSWEKRGKKGYLFVIGDERVYARSERSKVKDLIDDDLQENPDTRAVLAELQEKWEVFYLFASQGSYSKENVVDVRASDATALSWGDLLGQNAIVLDDADAVCETIALTIGIAEGAIGLSAGLDDLRETGSDEKAIEATSRALATVGAGTVAVAGDASGALELGDDDGAERL